MIVIGLLIVVIGLGFTGFSVVRMRRHPSQALTASAEGRRLIILATGAALLMALALAVIPIYATSTGNRATLVEVNGVDVLLMLLLPVLLAASPLLARGGTGQVLLAASCGTLLAVFCVLGGFTIGSFYLPAAALLLGAAATGLRSTRTG